MISLSNSLSMVLTIIVVLAIAGVIMFLLYKKEKERRVIAETKVVRFKKAYEDNPDLRQKFNKLDKEVEDEVKVIKKSSKSDKLKRANSKFK